jgi:hypothetical protein
MDSAVEGDLEAHSFIVRVWLEEDSPGSTHPRGHVAHVLSDTRRYFDDFSELTDFIASYLDSDKAPARKR